MKTKFILFLLLFFSATIFAQEVKRVAILETVDKENKVSYANKLILRASLSKAITQTEGYEAYDRTDVDAIMSEQDFQRTGMVSNDQIKRLGEMTGANYILVAEAAQLDDKKTMFITAKLLDVETARTIMTDYVMMGTTADAIQEGCTILSEKLFSNTTKSTPSKVAANTSVSQIPQMSANIGNGETFVINSKSTQKMFGVKKYTYNGNQMDEKAFVQFLFRNNTKVYADYVKSKRLIPAGWWTMGAGIVSMVAIGTGCMCARDEYYTSSYGYGYWYTSNEAITAGISFISIGAVATVASIPVICVGHAKRKNVINSLNKDSYIANNNSETTQPSVNLSLQANQNGIGLALNF